MLPQSFETDSPFIHFVIHGKGIPGIQFRSTKADNTNTVDLPIEGPGTFKLRLVRVGATITVWSAKNGAPLRELGHTANQLGSPVLLGLGVSSHTQAAVNTVLPSDVSVEQPAPPREQEKVMLNPCKLLLICVAAALALAQNANLGNFTDSADVGSPARKGCTEFDTASGQYKVTDSGANIWDKQDQFQFVWKEMSGNFAVTATLQVSR